MLMPAGVLFIAAIYAFVSIFFSRLPLRWGSWRGKGFPMSPIGKAAWCFFFLYTSAMLGLSPPGRIGDAMFAIYFVLLILMFLVSLHDWRLYKRN